MKEKTKVPFPYYTREQYNRLYITRPENACISMEGSNTYVINSIIPQIEVKLLLKKEKKIIQY